MAQTKKKTLLKLAIGVAVSAAFIVWVGRRYQVFVVKFIGGAAGPVYARGPSKWFMTKDTAMAFAQLQGNQAVAVVADRNGGILEGYRDHFMSGEELDAFIVNAEQAGLKLENTAAA